MEYREHDRLSVSGRSKELNDNPFYTKFNESNGCRQRRRLMRKVCARGGTQTVWGGKAALQRQTRVRGVSGGGSNGVSKVWGRGAVRGQAGPGRRLLGQKQKMSIGEDVESFETQAEAWDFDVLNNSHHHVCVPGRRGEEGRRRSVGEEC